MHSAIESNHGLQRLQERAAVAAEMLEHCLCKCKQLSRLPDEAFLHAQSAKWAARSVDPADEAEEDASDALSGTKEAIEHASIAAADLEAGARSLHCLLQAAYDA